MRTADSEQGAAQHELVIDAEGATKTLAAHVREALGLSWGRAKKAVSSGRVSLDGQAQSDPAGRPRLGQRLTIATHAPKRTRGLPDSAILHLDRDVVVVEKPAGLLTIAYDDDDRRPTLLDEVRLALRRRLAKRGRKGARDPFVGVVQRLDRETSGVLVLSLTQLAHAGLKAQLFEHTVTRRYRALAHGAVASRRIESAIVQDRGDGLRGSWGTRREHDGPAPKHAKRCVTHVEALETLGVATLVGCRLETGRQHQIRIHLSEAGHPLLGEPVYIRELPEARRIEASRPMLHAAELGFSHPRTAERLRFSRPPPADFRARLEALRRGD